MPPDCIRMQDTMHKRNTELQGEHKVFPWLQTFITRKLREYFYLPLIKIVSKILYHVFIVMLQLHNLLVSKWRQ